MSDIPGISSTSVVSDQGLGPEEYFRRNYGYEAWLLDIPSVRDALVPVLERHGDDAQIQAAIQGTTWWRSQADAQKQYADLVARNPSEAENQVRMARTQIEQRAAKIGFSLDPARTQQMAEDAVRFGWDSYTYESALAKEAAASVNRPVAGGNIAASAQQVRQAAAAYFIKLDDQTALNYGRGIANGTMTLPGVNAIFVEQQSKNRPELAAQLAQGATMEDLFNFHRQQIASTLEMDPNSIDFINNPTWSKVTDFVPPGETARRAMTVPEALSYARSQTAYRYTAQANATTAAMTDKILTTWGKK